MADQKQSSPETELAPMFDLVDEPVGVVGHTDDPHLSSDALDSSLDLSAAHITSNPTDKLHVHSNFDRLLDEEPSCCAELNNLNWGIGVSCSLQSDKYMSRLSYHVTAILFGALLFLVSLVWFYSKATPYVVQNNSLHTWFLALGFLHSIAYGSMLIQFVLMRVVTSCLAQSRQYEAYFLLLSMASSSALIITSVSVLFLWRDVISFESQDKRELADRIWVAGVIYAGIKIVSKNSQQVVLFRRNKDLYLNRLNQLKFRRAVLNALVPEWKRQARLFARVKPHTHKKKPKQQPKREPVSKVTQSVPLDNRSSTTDDLIGLRNRRIETKTALAALDLAGSTLPPPKSQSLDNVLGSDSSGLSLGSFKSKLHNIKGDLKLRFHWRQKTTQDQKVAFYEEEIMTALDKTDKGYIAREDLDLHFSAKNADRAFAWLSVDHSVQHVLPSTLHQVLGAYFDDEKVVKGSLTSFHNLSKVITSLITFGYNSLAVVVLLVYVADIHLDSLLLSIGTIGLSLSFAFGTSIKNAVDSAVFLLKVRPFDVGDLVAFDEEEGVTGYRVEKIHLFATSFRTTRGKEMIVPNHILYTKFIYNLSHSPNARFRCEIQVSVKTPVEALNSVGRGMLAFVKAHSAWWRSELDIFVKRIEYSNSMVLHVWATHTLPFSSPFELWRSRTDFLNHLRFLLEQEQIAWQSPPQPVVLQGQLPRGIQ